MANTTNFGWETPDDTDLVKDGAAAIRTLAGAIDTSLVDLKGGTTNQVLAKNSDTNMDFKWVADAAGMTNPMTTTGDTIYSSSGSTPARLAIGSTGNVLTVAGGVPTWAAPAGGATFVGVSVWHDANQTTANNTDLVLAMNQEVFDTDGFHSTTTNNSRLTVPAGKAGKYFVRGLIAYDYDPDGFRDVRIFKNGSIVSVTRMQPPTGDTYGAIQEGSYILSLAEGDYIELIARQTSGGNLIAQTAGSAIYPQLQMFLIGA